MAIPFPSARRTSAKGPFKRGSRAARIKVICPVCKKKTISLTRSEFKKRTDNGKKLITCSRTCGSKLRSMRENGIIENR